MLDFFRTFWLGVGSRDALEEPGCVYVDKVLTREYDCSNKSIIECDELLLDEKRLVFPIRQLKLDISCLLEVLIGKYS